MEMTDLGKKVPDHSVNDPAIANDTKNKKTKIIWPSFSICEDQIPTFLDDIDVGQEIRCEVVIRKIGQNENEQYSEDRQEFAIKNIGLIGKVGEKSKDEYMRMSQDEKDAYDQSQMEEGPSEDIQEGK